MDVDSGKLVSGTGIRGRGQESELDIPQSTLDTSDEGICGTVFPEMRIHVSFRGFQADADLQIWMSVHQHGHSQLTQCKLRVTISFFCSVTLYMYRPVNKADTPCTFTIAYTFIRVNLWMGATSAANGISGKEKSLPVCKQVLHPVKR